MDTFSTNNFVTRKVGALGFKGLLVLKHLNLCFLNECCNYHTRVCSWVLSTPAKAELPCHMAHYWNQQEWAEWSQWQLALSRLLPVNSSLPSLGMACLLHEITWWTESFRNIAAQRLFAEGILKILYLKRYKKAFRGSLWFRVTMVFLFEPRVPKISISLWLSLPMIVLWITMQQRMWYTEIVYYSEKYRPLYLNQKCHQRTKHLNNYMDRLHSYVFRFSAKLLCFYSKRKEKTNSQEIFTSYLIKQFLTVSAW